MQFDVGSPPQAQAPAAIRRSVSKFQRVGRQLFGRETVRAVLILLAILNLDFFPCIWGHKTLLESAQWSQSVLATGAYQGKHLASVRFPKTLDPAAAAWVTEPFLAFTGSEYWRAKTLPLWNPYQGLGVPYAANMQSQPFYPLALLFSVHVTPTTYNLFLLSRLFLLGIGAYLYLRLFVAFVPAITGGTAAMLGGYFLLVISLPYLSVETLIPAVLFTAELLVRTPARSTICAFAVVSALSILGGMPESSLLLYVLVFCYIAFRIAFDPELRRTWLKRSLSMVAATVIGLCLAAFLLLPTLEYLNHSYNTHEPQKNAGKIAALWHDRFDQSIFTYLFPLLLGEPFASTLRPYNYNGNGARNYFGVIALFLALVALLSVRRARDPAEKRLRQIAIFFWICSVLVILERYGFRPIDALGSLPGLRLVTLVKYDEPILTVSVAILCGIGLHRIATRSASWRVQIAALVITFLTIPAAIFLSRNLLMKELWTDRVLPSFPLIAIGLPVCLLFLLTLCYIVDGYGGFSRAGESTKAISLSIGLFLLLTAEMSLNYIPELYYSFSKLPDVTENPYAGAPYIRWLQKEDQDRSRLFARGGTLYPDWASVFRLPDVRDLDALYYWKYLPFIRDFMLSPGQVGSDDFADRFTGSGSYSYSFATPLERRLLQLSSVRYLVTNAPYQEPEFRLKYDHEVKIYAYDSTLSRASIYFRAKVANNDQQVLQQLRDSGFNPFQTVLLDAAQLGPNQAAQIAEMNRSPEKPVEAATIVSYTPQRVDIAASLTQPAIVMLNDSDYPGWRVTVDGKPSRLLSADFMFRGVLLPAGRHQIRFFYRSRAFTEGATVTILTLVGLVLWYSGFGQKYTSWITSPGIR